MLQEILAAIGGGAEGLSSGLKYERDDQFRKAKLEEDNESRRLQAEIRAMIAELNEGGRNARHVTPSANVQLQQDGANSRTAATNDTRLAVTDANNATRERGQDITHSLGMARDTTTRRGQDFTVNTATQRDATTRRAQDLTHELGMQRDATTRRGQDYGVNTAATAAQLREMEIKQRENAERARRLQQDREDLGQGFRGTYDFLEGQQTPGAGRTDIELPETGTGRPTAQPIEIEPPAQGAAPRSPEANADQERVLTTQAQSLITQIQRTADPAQKQALAAELQRLKASILKARGK